MVYFGSIPENILYNSVLMIRLFKLFPLIFGPLAQLVRARAC